MLVNWQDRLEAYFVDGNDTHRHIYECYRRLRNLRAVTRRREMVGTVSRGSL